MSIEGAAVISQPGSVSLKTLPPLSLYVHIPWCVRKCPYCDFNSHEVRGKSEGGAPEEDYVPALVADLELALPQIWGRRVYSIFFGGGTPSLFSARAIEQLLAAFRARLNLAADAEITLEANPGTFESNKFRDYRACGVNRLSIGIQSFNPAHLQALGRIHDGEEARRAIGIAQAHFDNINLDLMYALPRQTLREAEQDINTAAGFGTAHLSAYHLTLEPNTLFHLHPPPLPDPELAADMQDMIDERLAGGGYLNYETSAFARPGHECRHNLNYWRFGDYLGIGAGAHSKLSFPDRILRQMRYKQPHEYLRKTAAGAQVQEEHAVSRKDLGFEFMMNALRLTGGFEAALFAERTGLALTTVEQPLREATERGLITRDHVRIAPTLRGRRFLNDLLQLFLPPGGTDSNSA
ncbi:MAG: oxygen-independent coproporphyrinogen III oxidase-like protein [Burkholderiales bacterium]|nr:oxygen-independent coproporphyrinogen III oxidase-like protein [Burkholderiales bacterium]